MNGPTIAVIVLVSLLFVGLLVSTIVVNGPTHNIPMNVSAPSPLVDSLLAKAQGSNTCPNSGVPAPLSGSCGKLPRAGLISNTTGCPSTFSNVAQCSHLNSWSVNKQGFTADNVYSALIDTDLFSVVVTKSSAGNVLSSSFKLVLSNSGGCNAKIASLVAILDQSGVGGSDSYGPSGKNYKLWASSGSENAATAGKCNTLGMAQICYSNCNISLPFVEGGLTNLNTNGPLDLSPVIVPASSGCTGALTLNLQANFAVSDAVLAQMRTNSNGYRIQVFTTFDACCDRGSSCGVDIDCDGTVNVINTLQTTSGLFALPIICIENCHSVQIKDQLLSIASNNTDSDCLYDAKMNNPYPTSTVLTSGVNMVITGKESCDTSSCECIGNGKYKVSFSNKAMLSPDVDTCINPVSGASLITNSAMTASHDYYCSYPAPVDCVVSQWTAWTPVNACSNPSCSVTSTRDRTIQVSPCHGGVECPTLNDQRTDPCSTDCVYDQDPACFLSTCDSSCHVTQTCNYPSRDSHHCSNGVSTVCATITNATDSPCSTPACTYSQQQPCTTTDCNASTCTQNQTCVDTPNVFNYCLDGDRVVCEPISHIQQIACNIPCSYSAWNEWSAYTTCDCNQMNRTRTRTDTSVCRQGVDPCVDTTQVDVQPCTCPTPVPTPTPTPECPVDTECQYVTTPCSQPSPCNIDTCTQSISCAYFPSPSYQCVNGYRVACDEIFNSTTQTCTLPCQYYGWSDWSPFSTCSGSVSSCNHSKTRTRTVLGACPTTLIDSCTDTTDVFVQSCDCPVPTPTPIPITECISNVDCIYAENLCTLFSCVQGKCVSNGSVTCEQPTDKCQFSTCNANTGQCETHNTYCNDNNACTNDYCNSADGSCYSVNRTFSGALSPCTEAVCNPISGNFTIQSTQCPTGTLCSNFDSVCRPPCSTDLDCAYINPTNSKCFNPFCSGGMCSTTICAFGSQVCVPDTGCVKSCGFTVCLPGQIINKTDCTCIPAPVCDPNITCLPNYVFDNTTCQCKCGLQCGTGQYLDVQDCRCRCNQNSCDTPLSTNCVQRKCDIFNVTCAVVNNTICNDNNLCTNEPYATCVDSPTGYCLHNTVPQSFQSCYISGCNPLTGPYSLPINCDDGNNITIDSCILNKCRHVPINCSDSDPCTADSLNITDLTCIHTPIPSCCRSNQDCGGSYDGCFYDLHLNYSVCKTNNTLLNLANLSTCNNAVTCSSGSDCLSNWCMFGRCVSSCQPKTGCAGRCFTESQFNNGNGYCQPLRDDCLSDGCRIGTCIDNACVYIPNNDACNYLDGFQQGICDGKGAVDSNLNLVTCDGDHCASCDQNYSSNGATIFSCSCPIN